MMANKSETRIPLSEQHHIQISPETIHVLIAAKDEPKTLLAKAVKPLVLREKQFRDDISDFKAYPDVYYIPPHDVQYSQLRKTDTKTFCPYKGYASYYALIDGNEDVAWVYEDPFDQVGAIKGHLAFYPSKVAINYG